MERIARVTGRRRAVRHVPPRLAFLVSRASSLFTREPLVTKDELVLMAEDVCGHVEEFVELTGEEPLGLDDCLERSFGFARGASP